MSGLSGQAFAQSYVELHKVRSVQFGLLNPEEVRRMSVVNIVNERIYDDRGVPNFNGINDPRMGTMDRDLKCFTCKGKQADCPGHFGHIELARPVYHAGLLEFIRKVLRCVCFYCSRLLANINNVEEIRRLKSSAARLAKVLKLSDGTKDCDPQLGGCGHRQPKFQRTGLGIQIEYMDEQYEAGKDRKQKLQPEEALRVLDMIKDEDCELMGFNPKVSKPSNMIIKNLAVAPLPVRPSVSMSNSMRSEDDLTYCYQKILSINTVLQNQINRGSNQTTINELRTNLQYYVATVMENPINGQPTQRHKSGKPLKAIRARLKGKEGRLRGNLMGKRVDYSARTVIGPDPNLQLDQLGVPQQIALNLTVPETVTNENIDEMRKLIDRGPNVWPGAKYIIRHDERQIDLSQMRNRSEATIHPGYKVERHLRDNDYVIFNRQPSLHKMSLMGHRVKVLPFSTFRLNLSVTSPYNADFDGDEMNMHVPQSYETMAEIKEIMAVPNQIVSPQSNRPVMGIVQDSLLGVMLFTLKDTFIEKELVMQLLMWAKYEEDKFPEPTILKPKPLWTGKQIFSLIIPDINIQRQGEKKGLIWDSSGDLNILIRKGELICGNLTKGAIGASSGGMIHVIWKEKGPYCCRDFLSNTQLIINNWLHQNGFTVGVQDIIAKKEIVQKIRESMAMYKRKVQKISQKAQLGRLKSQPGKSMMESFEASVNQCLNKARDDCGNMALADLNSWNRLKAMVYAGSKGSNLNISQIMACVGQQNVEGKRIPFGFYKRSLPHFSKDDFGPESKGFVENCYLNGLTPQEFFFHAMGGREGLIDTAVKTAETGYIQRRLIKALEDVMVKYDGTVRTSKEQIIQFLYGEDGMAGEYIEDLTINLLKMKNTDVQAKCKFLHKPKPNMSDNELEQHLGKFMDKESARKIISDPEICLQLENEYNQIIKDRDDLRFSILKSQEDAIHLPVNVPRIIWNAKEQFSIRPNSKSDLEPTFVLQQLKSLTDDLAPIPGVMITKDPLILEANSDSTWLFKIYLRSMLNSKAVIQQERLTKDAFLWILGEIKSRFDQALVNPGEMVGSIGAQSMGEPATQMTLNTFHFAGVSAKNVTLGVPRLKEIINVAKNIKTPSMKIYLNDFDKQNERVATMIGGRIEHTTLCDVVTSSAIFYDPDPEKTIVREDEELIRLYNEVRLFETEKIKLSPWIIRFVLDNDKVQFKDLSMQLIEQKINEIFGGQIDVVKSDENAEKLVLRLRVNDIQDDEDDRTICMYLKGFQEELFNDLALKGFHEIAKVTFTKYNDEIFDTETGECKQDKDCWLIETDGVALQKVLGLEGINYKKTVSNDIIEILRVLGIEAVRMSLINELRFVLSSYGIYVNYRHLSTLCDVMTQRGILTAITRHGINRVDSGPLRKCSFEETVEILLEAAVFAEVDPMKGVTENLIMGQLAPFGTGCFELTIDPEVLRENAQTKPEEEDQIGGFTPMIYQESYNELDVGGGYGINTPIAMGTPQQDYGGASTYSAFNTPNYQGGFSPAHGFESSPMYGGMSPSYNGHTTPPYASAYRNVSTPIYNATTSPIYQPNQGGSQSPIGNQASPIYSPTTQNYRSPAYNNSVSPGYYRTPGGASSSPVYSQTLGSHQSPSYSPTQNQGSGSYSPTNQNYSSSPHYSPTTPAYNQQYSPSYSPTSNVVGSGLNQTPRYQIHQSSSYGMSGSHQSGTPSGNIRSTSLYVPSSPAYNPTNSPGYNMSGRGNPTYGGDSSPIEDSEESQDQQNNNNNTNNRK